jgi:hypothetical protein
MKDLVYISRNFTEFGGFAPSEIVDFQQRGILCESDFVREHGSEAWQPLIEWLTSAVTDAPAPKVAKPKAKAPAKKKTAKNGAKKEKAAA